jgi:hypothetical protein
MVVSGNTVGTSCSVLCSRSIYSPSLSSQHCGRHCASQQFGNTRRSLPDILTVLMQIVRHRGRRKSTGNRCPHSRAVLIILQVPQRLLSLCAPAARKATQTLSFSAGERLRVLRLAPTILDDRSTHPMTEGDSPFISSAYVVSTTRALSVASRGWNSWSLVLSGGSKAKFAVQDHF